MKNLKFEYIVKLKKNNFIRFYGYNVICIFYLFNFKLRLFVLYFEVIRIIILGYLICNLR